MVFLFSVGVYVGSLLTADCEASGERREISGYKLRGRCASAVRPTLYQETSTPTA